MNNKSLSEMPKNLKVLKALLFGLFGWLFLFEEDFERV